jgi:hypothetical protein
MLYKENEYQNIEFGEEEEFIDDATAPKAQEQRALQ